MALLQVTRYCSERKRFNYVVLAGIHNTPKHPFFFFFFPLAMIKAYGQAWRRSIPGKKRVVYRTQVSHSLVIFTRKNTHRA